MTLKIVRHIKSAIKNDWARLPDLSSLCDEHHPGILRLCSCDGDGVRRVSGLRREPVVSVKNPTLIPTSHWKDDPNPVVADSDPLVASSMRVFCARNSQWEGRSLPWHAVGCRDQCGVLYGNDRFPTLSRDPTYHVIYRLYNISGRNGASKKGSVNKKIWTARLGKHLSV